MKKILKRTFIVIFFLFIISVLTISYLRYEALKRISDYIKIYGNFSSLDLKPFPPSLIASDISIMLPEKIGELKVKNARIEVGTKGLFSKKIVFSLNLDSPEINIYSLKTQKGKKRKLPNFDIESGRVTNGSLKLEQNGTAIDISSINGTFFWKKERLSLNIKNSLIKIKNEKKGIEEKGQIKLILRSEKGRIRIRKLEINSDRGEIFTHASVFHKKDEIHIDGKISAEIHPLEILKKVNIRGKLEGDYKIDKLSSNIMTMGELKLHPIINNVNTKEIFLNFRINDKLRGDIFLNSKEWNAHFKISKDRIDNFSINHLPTEYLNTFFFQIPEGFHANLSGEMTKGKLEGEYTLLYENDEIVKGNLNFEDKNYFVQANQINMKGAQGEGTILIKDKNINISGKLKEINLEELKNLNLLKRFFDTSKIPFLEGKGSCEFEISGSPESLETNANFHFENLKIMRFIFSEFNGEIRGINDNLRLDGKLGGPFEGKVNGSLKEKKFQIEIQRMKAESIWKEFKGNILGDVNFNFQDKIEAEGKFSSSLLKIGNTEIKDISLPFKFQNEKFTSFFSFASNISNSKGELSIDLKEKRYKISIPKIQLPLQEIYKDVKGEIEITLNGEGDIYRSPLGIKGKIKEFSFKGSGSKNYEMNTRIFLKEEGLSGEGNLFSIDKIDHLSFSFDLLKEGSLKGNFSGNVNKIEKLIKFPGENVNIKFIGEVHRKNDSIKIQSISNVEGKSLFIKGFAQDFKDFSGTIQQENKILNLRNFRAKIGGGDVRGYGEARIEKRSLEGIKLRLEGEKMRLSPFEKVDGFGDGRIELTGNLDEINIYGNFTVHRLFWRKEIGEKIAFSSSPSSPDSPKIFKKIHLNIGIKSSGNSWMENSWGKVEGKFDLRVSGDSSNPLLFGNITGIRGELNVGDRRFKLMRAEIYFNSPFTIDPELYILADTYIKDYRILFEVKGRASKPFPQLTSSPPLSSQDILTLLSLGEIYQRASYRTETQLGSATLLSMEVAEQLKSRAKKLFGIDRLRVDPYLLGSSSNPVARLTVGKKVSKDLIVIYSSDLSGQREYIFYIEYSISENFSLIGMRNENGSLSFDLKLVKRIGQ